VSKRQYEIRARNFCDTLTFTVKPNLIKCDTAMEAITTPHANGGGVPGQNFGVPITTKFCVMTRLGNGSICSGRSPTDTKGGAPSANLSLPC